MVTRRYPIFTHGQPLDMVVDGMLVELPVTWSMVVPDGQGLNGNAEIEVTGTVAQLDEFELRYIGTAI